MRGFALPDFFREETDISGQQGVVKEGDGVGGCSGRGDLTARGPGLG